MEDNKKYRYTKQLVNMALRDGWTQKLIADTCRTQQSVVSAWKSGASQAKESQLKKLLEIYGPRLRRKSFKVYHNWYTDDQNIPNIRMIKVEGEVILAFPHRNKKFCTKCHSESPPCFCSPNAKRILPTRKLIVHAMGKGDFCLIQQSRLIKDQYQMQFPETNIFISSVVGHFTVQGLLSNFSFLDKTDDPDEKMNDAEHLMAQMLLRKALLEHGYPVEGIEEHLASW